MIDPDIAAALRQLDPDGGWDHEGRGWSEQIHKGLRKAENEYLVDYGVSFDIPHWRLTDAGIQLRHDLDHLPPKV